VFFLQKLITEYRFGTLYSVYILFGVKVRKLLREFKELNQSTTKRDLGMTIAVGVQGLSVLSLFVKRDFQKFVQSLIQPPSIN
jgi:undecaprenyl pyrophosphate phosphatase UppP